jgi:hypothetical protein
MRYAAPIRPSLLFATIFAALVVAGAVGMREVSWLRSARHVVPPIPSAAPWFPVIVAGSGNYDHTILWNDIHSSIANARGADVLFVGSSQLQFALPSHSVDAFEKQTGLKAFSIATPGGGDVFATALIEKFDLRPRLLVAEISTFRPPGDIPEGRRVRETSRWSAVTSVWELRLAAIAWSVGSPLLPVFATPRASQLLLRSSQNGTWWPIGWPHTHGSVPTVVGPMHWDTGTARRFAAFLAARGTQLVLTCVPSAARGCEILSAQPLADALHVPAAIPRVDGLWSMDRAHLCPLSGKRYGRALLRDLARLDVVRAVARERRVTRLVRGPSSAPLDEAR